VRWRVGARQRASPNRVAGVGGFLAAVIGSDFGGVGDALPLRGRQPPVLPRECEQGHLANYALEHQPRSHYSHSRGAHCRAGRASRCGSRSQLHRVDDRHHHHRRSHCSSAVKCRWKGRRTDRQRAGGSPAPLPRGRILPPSGVMCST